jgi:hypothetical protein
MAAQEKQTIYLNYPATAQTETIAVTPSGGTAPYSYGWTRSNCNGAIMSNLATVVSSHTFSPTASDICAVNNDNVYNFVCTVTDKWGCATVTSKKLNVVDPYTLNGDVLLCHKVVVRGGSIASILSMNPSLAATHLAHGDYLGNCVLFTGAKSTAPVPTTEGMQQVAIYPNPTTGVFILELSYVYHEASIVITDVLGKMVAATSIARDEVPTATFDLGMLPRGMYLVQVRDGELNYRTKIVLQ